MSRAPWKTLMSAAGLTALGMLVAAAPASAASDAQACADAGGTFTKDQGTATCQFPVGSSDNTKDASQKGSFASSQGETFTNPGGNQPSGQQGGDRVQR